MVLAPDDYNDATGVLNIVEGATVLCVGITIISDHEDEHDRECFAFIMSITPMEGVFLEMAQATICITDDDGDLICM